MWRAAWLAIAVLWIGTGVVGDASGQEDRRTADVTALGWMAGAWASEDGRVEELWLPPKGGVMLGLHREVSAGGDVFFEYLRIEQHADAVVYQASPMGREPTPFRSVEIGVQRVVFDRAGRISRPVLGSSFQWVRVDSCGWTFASSV